MRFRLMQLEIKFLIRLCVGGFMCHSPKGFTHELVVLDEHYGIEKGKSRVHDIA